MNQSINIITSNKITHQTQEKFISHYSISKCRLSRFFHVDFTSEQSSTPLKLEAMQIYYKYRLNMITLIIISHEYKSYTTLCLIYLFNKLQADRF